MALELSVEVRNAMVDAINAFLNTTGSIDPSADLAVFTEGAAELVVFPFQNPAFGAASGGAIALLGTPINAIASGTGAAARFSVRTRDNLMAMNGTMTIVGGGGDMEANALAIAQGQLCTLEGFSYLLPAS